MSSSVVTLVQILTPNLGFLLEVEWTCFGDHQVIGPGVGHNGTEKSIIWNIIFPLFELSGQGLRRRLLKISHSEF